MKPPHIILDQRLLGEAMNLATHNVERIEV